MKWIIIDGNELDEDVEIDSYEELREWTTDMLVHYFEARSEYGDPVSWLMPFIADDKLVPLIEEYNYGVEIRE